MYALLYIWAKINKQKNKLDKSSLKIKLAAIKMSLCIEKQGSESSLETLDINIINEVVSKRINDCPEISDHSVR